MHKILKVCLSATYLNGHMFFKKGDVSFYCLAYVCQQNFLITFRMLSLRLWSIEFESVREIISEIARKPLILRHNLLHHYCSTERNSYNQHKLLWSWDLFHTCYKLHLILKENESLKNQNTTWSTCNMLATVANKILPRVQYCHYYISISIFSFGNTFTRILTRNIVTRP